MPNDLAKYLYDILEAAIVWSVIQDDLKNLTKDVEKLLSEIK